MRGGEARSQSAPTRSVPDWTWVAPKSAFSEAKPCPSARAASHPRETYYHRSRWSLENLTTAYCLLPIAFPCSLLPIIPYIPYNQSTVWKLYRLYQLFIQEKL
ncbi:MAG: hypothetical protein IJF84_05495 [Thermoguttaceae bacterium]|nr:hypothetical protein [Thermoguttaceae bacterium]